MAVEGRFDGRNGIEVIATQDQTLQTVYHVTNILHTLTANAI